MTSCTWTGISTKEAGKEGEREVEIRISACCFACAWFFVW